MKSLSVHHKKVRRHREGARRVLQGAQLAVFFVLAGLLSSGPARAESRKAKVLIILAKEAPGKIASELKSIEALKRPPFNSFRSMEVLSSPGISMALKKPGEVELPNGRILRLTIEQKQGDGKYLVSASLKTPKKKKYTMLLRVVAAPGAPFFVAGQKYKEGTLIIGVTLK